MKRNKLLALLLALALIVSMAACSPTNSDEPPTSTAPAGTVAPTEPAGTTEPANPTEPAGGAPTSFLWDNFEGRDPNSKPDNAPNGAPMWWDNWANLRASVEDGVVKINYRPKAFDPEDYDNMDDYYARAADWMGNWGEAIDMWSLEGISYCKYLTIRIKGEAGGEEKKLIMDWHPEDAKFYAARFSDLVLADGSHPVITTEWQDLVIDLQASGFPGMTNALHIRAFAECTIYLDEIYFSEPLAPIDTTRTDTIVGGFNVPESGKPAELPIKDYLAG